MSDVEDVNAIKTILLKLCEMIDDVGKQGIRVEFRALKEMKLSS